MNLDQSTFLQLEGSSLQEVENDAAVEESVTGLCVYIHSVNVCVHVLCWYF